MHLIVMETQFYANLVYRVHRSRIAKLYHAGQRSLLRQHKSIRRRGCFVHVHDLFLSVSQRKYVVGQ